MKKILAINYSQTGQLDDIITQFLKPLQGVERVKIEVKQPFEFPWTGSRFFDAMPESVLEIPTELNPFKLISSDFDLIIIGYQPWFLSPSIPTTSLLKTEQFKEIIKGKPVITVIGARNMWLNAHESVKAMLQDAGAVLVGNIPMIDRSNNLLSAVSILHWMLNGKKTKLGGIFPTPGIREKDINFSHEYGTLVRDHLEKNQLNELQDKFLSLNKISISSNILFIEERAKKIFNLWANIIKKKGKSPKQRKRWLTAFKYYLIIALFIVSPIVLLIYTILFKPFTKNRQKRKMEYYCGINRQ